MGKGFDTFMKNPYWRNYYENAPSDALRRYLRKNWDLSPFVMGEDYEDEEAEKDAIESGSKLSREDMKYLYDNSTGMEKSYLKKWLVKFD